jgi:membrane dipeptidase
LSAGLGREKFSYRHFFDVINNTLKKHPDTRRVSPALLEGCMAQLSRRNVLIGGGVIGAAALGGGYWFTRKKDVPLGFTLSDAELAEARAFLAVYPAFDSHAHPGRTFVRGATGLAPKLKLYKALGTFEKKTVADMREGGMAAASFALVSDFQVLNLGDHGLVAQRDFAPGEAWASYQRQMKNLKALASKGLVQALHHPDDLAKAQKAGAIGAWFTAEGGDFLEGKPSRIHSAYSDGLRAITLMHYRPNALGDIMTAAPIHGGLSETGKTVVQTMNDAGMVVDTAHASEATVRGVLKASRAPVLCSHTHIQSKSMPKTPRFISADLAREIAAQGGIVGLWPAGFGISTLWGLIERAMELVELLGPDHVCLGTDMDANYKPVMETYQKTPWLVGGLLKRGLSQSDTAKLMGGNILRLWREALAVSQNQ